jgi:hypothetical protein
MTLRVLSQIVFAFAVVPTTALASDTRYESRVVSAGTVSQMARSARDAINCGFEVVTIRPWHDGDIQKPGMPDPMVLIVQPPVNDAKMNSAFSCFYQKSGLDRVTG